jgi:hypothetical protein
VTNANRSGSLARERLLAECRSGFSIWALNGVTSAQSPSAELAIPQQAILGDAKITKKFGEVPNDLGDL